MCTPVEGREDHLELELQEAVVWVLPTTLGSSGSVASTLKSMSHLQPPFQILHCLTYHGD